MSSTCEELIVYACPVGELAEQLGRYFARSLAECGHNGAHDFMAHVTLTGFFHDVEESIAGYVDALGRAIVSVPPVGAPATVTGRLLQADFHLLTVESPWLRSVVGAFCAATSTWTTRVDPIRPKQWLHLSLAYAFGPELHGPLSRLALECVDPDASCEWEIRFYQRRGPGRWSLLAAWPCPSG